MNTTIPSLQQHEFSNFRTNKFHLSHPSFECLPPKIPTKNKKNQCCGPTVAVYCNPQPLTTTLVVIWDRVWVFFLIPPFEELSFNLNKQAKNKKIKTKMELIIKTVTGFKSRLSILMYPNMRFQLSQSPPCTLKC